MQQPSTKHPYVVVASIATEDVLEACDDELVMNDIEYFSWLWNS